MGMKGLAAIGLGLTLVGACTVAGVKGAIESARMPYEPTTVEKILDGSAGYNVRVEAEPVNAVMQCGLLDCYTRITIQDESGRQLSFWGMRYNEVAERLAANVIAEAYDGDEEPMVVEAAYGLDGFIPHHLYVNGQRF